MILAMIFREFGLALMLLTRVPGSWLAGPAPISAARAVWAFPLVGALVGAAGGLVLVAARTVGMPTGPAAAWALVAMALIGGGLHEDGLADMADGFGGGGSAERKLEIMRDSRIGSYGALALVFATAIRLLSIAVLPGSPIAALVAAGALSRGSLAVPLLLLGPARPGGLGALVLGAGMRRWICLTVAVGVAAVVLPPGRAMASCGAALGAALVVTWLARAQIGGFTGDVLGGCAVAAECAGLTALACT